MNKILCLRPNILYLTYKRNGQINRPLKLKRVQNISTILPYWFVARPRTRTQSQTWRSNLGPLNNNNRSTLQGKVDLELKLARPERNMASAVNGPTPSSRKDEEFYSTKTVALSRLMLPDDANIAGNVHGGTLLKMIEEAGVIITTKYCNNVNKDDVSYQPSVCALARVERTDFLQPVYVGEVVELTAEIIYTSPHSLLVEVAVFAENMIKGEKRKTNRAHLWYVPLCLEPPYKVMPVPPMVYTAEGQEQRGREEYERQKATRQLNDVDKTTIHMQTQEGAELHTVAYSQSMLIHLVGVSEVNQSGFCRGGVILKMMDECAGMVAAKHCRTNIVTACLEAINFHRRVPKGSLLTLLAQPVFTSARSIEIEVVVETEVPWGANPSEKTKAVDAFFTFVSLDENRKTLPVPPLKVQDPAPLEVLTEEEETRFAAAKKRYEYKKELRSKANNK